MRGEGADVLLSYLDEEEDAQAAAASVREAGRQAVLLPGDIADPAHCRTLVAAAIDRFGRLDILVNNGATQTTRTKLDEITDDEWDRTFRVNVHSQFYLCKAALPHLQPGASIINTSSVKLQASDAEPAGLFRHQGRHRQLHHRPGPAAGGAGRAGQRSAAGPDLDALHPHRHGAGAGGAVR